MRSILAGACLALLAGCAAPAVGHALPPAGVVGVEAAAPQPVALDGSCTGPAGIEVAYPADWTARDDGFTPGCSLFSAEPFPVVTGSDVRTAAVRVTVDDLAFERAAVTLPDDVARSEETVYGRRAVRIESVAGPGLWPEGTPSTRWVVDLGGRVLVADAVGLPPFDHERDVEVLDAMVQALELPETA